MENVSEARLLGVLAEFDPLGGASLGLSAWELFATEQQLQGAWQRAINQGWLAPAGYDQVYNERLWRLTASGRAAAQAAEDLTRPAE
jgi:hypothetical protein